MGKRRKRSAGYEPTAAEIQAQHLAWREVTVQEAKANRQRHREQGLIGGRRAAY